MVTTIFEDTWAAGGWYAAGFSGNTAGLLVINLFLSGFRYQRVFLDSCVCVRLFVVDLVSEACLFTLPASSCQELIHLK